VRTALRIALLALIIFAAIQASRTGFSVEWVVALFLGGVAVALTSADVLRTARH
jgi:hypothetical protein